MKKAIIAFWIILFCIGAFFIGNIIFATRTAEAQIAASDSIKQSQASTSEPPVTRQEVREIAREEIAKDKQQSEIETEPNTVEIHNKNTEAEQSIGEKVKDKSESTILSIVLVIIVISLIVFPLRGSDGI